MDDPALELYKMEYEKCADRYDNIFKAVWANFSYMAFISGAILTFGGARFTIPVTIALACLPLLFWYFATFEPLNKYGDDAVKRLSEIEKLINEKYFGCFEMTNEEKAVLLKDLLKDIDLSFLPNDQKVTLSNKLTAYQQNTNGTASLKRGLSHFTSFGERNEMQPEKLLKKGFIKAQVRVRYIVRVTAILLIGVFLLFFITSIWYMFSREGINEGKIEIEVKDKSIQLKSTGVSTDALKNILSKQALEFFTEDEKGNKLKYRLILQPVSSPPSINSSQATGSSPVPSPTSIPTPVSKIIKSPQQ